MKLSDSCPYEFPCLMTGKKGTTWSGKVLIMAINQVDRPETFVNAIIVKTANYKDHSMLFPSEVGDNYGFDEESIMKQFEPYNGQVIIHSEEFELNLI